jgi:hypothetical protein
MTARHAEVDGGSIYHVATADGHTFELRAVENGYTFSTLQSGAGSPTSGLWSGRNDVCSASGLTTWLRAGA